MADTDTNYAKDNLNRLGSALQTQSNRGALSSAFQSCQVDGFFSRLIQYQKQTLSAQEKEKLELEDKKTIEKLYSPETTTKALKTLLKDDPHALDMLRPADLGYLVSLTTNFDTILGIFGIGSASDRKLLSDINKLYFPQNDDYFIKHTMPKYEKLFHDMEKDPLIKDARKNWNTYTETEKVHVAERIGRIQSSIFGYKAYDVEMYPAIYFSKEVVADANSSNGLIRLNQAYLQKGGDDFSKFVGTLVHENDHAFQNSVADKIGPIRNAENDWLEKNKKQFGNMTPQDIGAFNTYMRNWADKNLDGGLNNPTNPALLYGGSLRSFALVMQSSNDIYHESKHDKSREDYMFNPMEQHAYRIGVKTNLYFSSPEAKQIIINRMQYVYKEAEDSIQFIKQDLNQYRADTTCDKIPAPQINNGVEWK